MPDNPLSGRHSWSRMAADADLLDALDLKVIQAVAARCRWQGGPALDAVLACLLSVVKEGGLRLPLRHDRLVLSLLRSQTTIWLGVRSIDAFARGMESQPLLELQQAIPTRSRFMKAPSCKYGKFSWTPFFTS